MTNTLQTIILSETIASSSYFTGSVNIQGLYVGLSEYGFNETAQEYFFNEVNNDSALTYIFNQSLSGQRLNATTLSNQLRSSADMARRFMFLLTKCKEAWNNITQYKLIGSNTEVEFLNSTTYSGGTLNTPPPPYL